MPPDVYGLGPASPITPPVRAFRAVLLLAQRLRYLMDERLRPDGLTTQQAALLTAVIALDSPPLGAAAAALGTTHQNAAQLVSALERKGLLTVEPDPADRRRKRLVATDANARYWRGRDAGDEAAVASWFGTLSPAEVDTLVGLLTTVLDGLDRGAERGPRADK
jgi:DNA-binding MarR family transcriptional regulator